MIFVNQRKLIMPQAAPSKLCSLSELAERIPDGCALGLGGVFLHRGPFALVRELARQRRRNLEIIKASPGYDLDLLCRAEARWRKCGPASSPWRATSGSLRGTAGRSNARKPRSKSTPE